MEVVRDRGWLGEAVCVLLQLAMRRDQGQVYLHITDNMTTPLYFSPRISFPTLPPGVCRYTHLPKGLVYHSPSRGGEQTPGNG